MTEGRAGMTEGRAGRDASPVVIPDVFNRESMGGFPTPGYTNEGAEERHWIPANNRRE